MRHNEKQYLLIRKRVAKRAILPIVGLMGLSVLGGQWLYLEAKDKIQSIISPVEASIALPPEPTTPKDIICKATNGQNCDVIYNLCTKESGKFINIDKNDTEKCQKWATGKNTNGTFDFSWLQINDVHIIGRPASKGKGTISMECVYDLPCVAQWANEQIKKGNGHIWSTWDNI